MSEVKFLGPVREATGVKKAQISVEDVRKALSQLGKRFPTLEEEFLQSDGKYKKIVILLNGRNVDNLEGLDTPLEDDDSLALVPPVGGG